MELANVSFIQPIIDGAKKAGINYHKIMQQSSLKYFDCSHPDNRLPLNAAHEFVASMAKKQGLENVANEFVSSIKLSALSEYGELIASAPTFYDALYFSEKYCDAILSNEVMRLKIHGNKAVFYHSFSNLDPFDYESFMQINFIYLLDAFVYLSSEGFCPDQIHCQSGFDPTVLDLFPQFKNTKIVLNQPHTAFIFNASELNNKVSDCDQAKSTLDILNAGSLNHKIGLLIDSYNNEFGAPNIDTMSTILGLSERTLRRRLHEENTSFNEIMSSWRVRKSIELLEQTSHSVSDIAQRLHYTNANNFTRAFKKMFKVSPVNYRDNCMSDKLVH